MRAVAAGREPAASLDSTTVDSGLASTFDDDPGDWLDPDSGDFSGWGDRVLPSSVLDGEVTSGMGGAVRLGRYRVLGLIGEGRSARVYRGHDPILERAVALKVPRPGVLSAEKARERFLGEARALARLRHPAIVPVFEMGRDDDRCFIAMGLVEGPSLVETSERGPDAIGGRRAAEIVADLADALDHAHGQGVLHRDVKPANILTDEAGSVYLTDFGLAGRPDTGEGTRGPERIVGTPAYAAPEQVASYGSRSLPAGDQYSLGVVFYQLLCGRLPFTGPSLHVLCQAMIQEPPSPRSIAPAVPARLAAICMKAMAKRPEDRYARCADLARALKDWCRAG
jgi:serine/threonine protein kinase